MAGNPMDKYIKPAQTAQAAQQASPVVPQRSEGRELGFVADAGSSIRMIDFVLRDGNHVGLPYAYMLSAKLSGGAVIELLFTENVVLIRGRHLDPLFQHFLAQSARRVEESASGFDDDRTNTWVESITIESRD